MLIKQSQLLGEATAFLDTLDRLDSSDNTYSAQMVGIYGNNRLNADLIQLESFLEYSKRNGLTDGGYATYAVCEANGISPSVERRIAFVVNEENMFTNVELLEAYCQLINSNFDVYVNQISSASPYYTTLKEAMRLDEPYDRFEESRHLHKYINESIIDDAKDKVSRGANAVKDTVSNSTKDVAKKLASVRKEIVSLSSKAMKATGAHKISLNRQISKLKQTANELGRKLGSTKSSIAHQATGAMDSVQNAISKTRKRISSNIDNVSSHISNSAKDLTSSVSKNFDSAKEAVKSKFD